MSWICQLQTLALAVPKKSKTSRLSWRLLVFSAPFRSPLHFTAGASDLLHNVHAPWSVRISTSCTSRALQKTLSRLLCFSAILLFPGPLVTGSPGLRNNQCIKCQNATNFMTDRRNCHCAFFSFFSFFFLFSLSLSLLCSSAANTLTNLLLFTIVLSL